MRHLVALVVIAIVGCKSGDKPAPTPTPTEAGAGSSTATGSGSAAAGSAAAGSAAAGSAAAGSGSGSSTPTCVLTIALTQTNLSWSGGGISEGHSDYKPGEPPHVDVLKAVDPRCATLLTAADTMKYQDVIAVMDALVKLGLVNISLGKAGDPPTKRTTRPQPNIDMKWIKSADGKPTLQGTLDPMSGSPIAKDTLVLVITKTQVTFKGEVLATPDDDKLGDKITAKLPADPKDPTLIIQADANTSSRTIARVIEAAGVRGYTNVLFAVKNK
ncbi:MAG: biopolymer transporter ExbD [Kofleriaceae bacterium]